MFRRRVARREQIGTVEHHAQNRTRRVKIARPSSRQLILHRKLECLDGVVARLVERDHRTTVLDEGAERRGTRRTDATFQRIGIGATRSTGDGARLLVGYDDRIEPRAQITGADVLGRDGRKGNLVLVENPARPALVHRGREVGKDRDAARPVVRQPSRDPGRRANGRERRRFHDDGIRQGDDIEAKEQR